jgi:hypothetical protein
LQRANGVAPDACATLPPMSEKQLQSQVMAVAARLGWEKRYHTYNSKRSAAGFPDLVLCRPGRLLFTELKREGESPTIPQQQWLEALKQSVPGIEVYLWHPSDLPDIVEILR